MKSIDLSSWLLSMNLRWYRFDGILDVVNLAAHGFWKLEFRNVESDRVKLKVRDNFYFLSFSPLPNAKDELSIFIRLLFSLS